jgi:hypothetical protein
MGNYLVLTRDELFIILGKFKTLYWNPHISRETDEIMDIYHNFVLKKFKFPVEKNSDSLIIKKVISILDEILTKYVLHEFYTVSKSKARETDTIMNRDGREIVCLKVLKDIIKLYRTEFASEIYKILKFLYNKT